MVYGQGRSLRRGTCGYAACVASALALASACGGATSAGQDELPSASRAVSALDTDELGQLCRWLAERGEGGACSADGQPLDDVDGCVGRIAAVAPSCGARVGEVQACVESGGVGWGLCDSPSLSTASCAPLGVSGCRVEQVSKTVDRSYPPPDGCAPGSTASCYCADGRVGSQVCDEASGSFGVCVCASEGICDPMFCPSFGAGVPCCVSSTGPCGTDQGAGCMATGTTMSCDLPLCPVGSGTPCCLPTGGCGQDYGQGCTTEPPPQTGCDVAFCPGTYGPPCCLATGGCGVLGDGGCVRPLTATSCNPNFCPAPFGAPCCTASGVCGVDTGAGCAGPS